MSLLQVDRCSHALSRAAAPLAQRMMSTLFPVAIAFSSCSPAPHKVRVAPTAGTKQVASVRLTSSAPAKAVPSAAPPLSSSAPSRPTCRGDVPSRSPDVRFLKGEVHVHTGKSFDAITPVREVLAFYKQHGYDFVAVTDHNHVTIPKTNPGLLLIPGVELTYNATRCDPQPPRGNLCAFHTNVLFLDPLLDAHHGHYFNPPLRRTRRGAFEWEMKLAADLHGIPVFNHPTYQQAVDVPTIEEFVRQGLRFVEFFNGSVLDQADDRSAEVARLEQMWDHVLTGGLPVYAMAGDDAHHFSDADWVRRHGKKPKLGNRAWIYVRSNRSIEGIEQAILAGDFYASTGVVLEQLERSSQYLFVRVKLRPGEHVRVRFVGKGGKTLSEQDGPDACYRAKRGEMYLRAVVTSDAGGRAWTQAKFLREREGTTM